MSDVQIAVSFCWDFEDSSPDEGLSRLRDYGFEGIELWPRWLEKFGAEEWGRALRNAKMQCVQLCPYFDFVHGPEPIKQSRLELERFLGYAQTLGCHRLRAFTGPVPHTHAVEAQQVTPEQWSDAIAALSVFCDRAAEQNVELCLECHEGMLMETSAGALRLLNGVNRPNLTANPQIPLLDEDWQTTIRALGPFTSHLHMHNWHGAMEMSNLTYLSEGEFDWLPVIQSLVHDYKRQVCLSVEHATHTGRHESWETARRDGPFLQALKQKVLGEKP